MALLTRASRDGPECHVDPGNQFINRHGPVSVAVANAQRRDRRRCCRRCWGRKIHNDLKRIAVEVVARAWNDQAHHRSLTDGEIVHSGHKVYGDCVHGGGIIEGAECVEDPGRSDDVD